jgi:hypothetical protein
MVIQLTYFDTEEFKNKAINTLILYNTLNFQIKRNRGNRFYLKVGFYFSDYKQNEILDKIWKNQEYKNVEFQWYEDCFDIVFRKVGFIHAVRPRHS